MPDKTNDTARHAIKAAQIMGLVVMIALSNTDWAAVPPNPKPE
jgi:hypothetical protein